MQRYNPKEIEPKWQKIWDETGVYTTNLHSDKPKYIAMSMFNYPSGNLHIGHAMNYTISDVKARFKRQQGYESYHPVGWDSFGLPAENRAIKQGISPQESMGQLIPEYHRHYKAMGWSNDWEKEIATHLPEYYKWTQWIFTQMYKHGLAYQDARMQWWCEKDNTVLANEQVIDGKCWRHDGPEDPLVEKKEIKQWFFKITDYADELLEATKDLDWTESVKLAQKNWIGKSKGAEIDFEISDENKNLNFVILHGYTGRADKNWLPWLTEKLTQKGYRVQTPQMPNTDNPVEAEQVSYVLDNCIFDENTVLIGHSLGGAVAMKVLQKLNHDIHKLILVAPVVEPAFRGPNYATEKKRTFIDTFDLSYDYELIKAKTASRLILSESAEAADRKPYLEYLADKIDAPLYETEGKRVHFTGDIEPFILQHTLPAIKVFTTRPDTIFGATFLVVAPEHDLLENRDLSDEVRAYIDASLRKTELERMEAKDKTGVFTGLYAINPANSEKIPVWVADYVLAGYGTGAIMAVPAHDERDFEFASKYGLKIQTAVQAPEDFPDVEVDSPHSHGSVSLYTGEGIMMNSDRYDGMQSSEAREKIVADLAEKGVANEKVNYKMRDWSVSRQRYWGAPIPIIHCEKCGPVLVPDEQLPVVLPELTDFKPAGDGRSALARAKDWLNVECPDCGGPAERETDTLDTYICSSWYMYRYFDPHNQAQIFDPAIAQKWEPIDFYNGADHATAHLLYARFVTRFFTKIGLLKNPEPFKQFVFNGKITAQDGSMFSKSKGNGVDPLEIIEQGYGADALRTYLMFAAPLDVWARWDPQGVPGTYRFLNRLWTITQEYLETENAEISEQTQKDIRRSVHEMIKKTTIDLEENRYNTAIAAVMKCLNDLYKLKTKEFGKSDVWQEALEACVACIAPFAPHATDELWQQLGHSSSIHRDTWPKYDEKHLVSETVTIVVQVNGKVRANLKMPKDSTEDAIVESAKAADTVKAHLNGEPKRVIYIPNKLLNFVI